MLCAPDSNHQFRGCCTECHCPFVRGVIVCHTLIFVLLEGGVIFPVPPGDKWSTREILLITFTRRVFRGRGYYPPSGLLSPIMNGREWGVHLTQFADRGLVFTKPCSYGADGLSCYRCHEPSFSDEWKCPLCVQICLGLIGDSAQIFACRVFTLA